jgi:nicotinate-nucleotide adenylyltransferase
MDASDMASAARIGVFGGAFDPIHIGHLAIAEAAREACRLDAVLFIPTGAAPHKPRGRASAEDRYAMTVLATGPNPRFHVSRVEIDRPGRSYTVDTLRGLHEAYPRADFVLIMGADMAADFPHWREPDAILALAEVAAVMRPGIDGSLVERLHADQRFARMASVVGPSLAISSTDVRRRVEEGRSIGYLVPDTVSTYIAKAGLYRSAEG